MPYQDLIAQGIYRYDGTLPIQEQIYTLGRSSTLSAFGGNNSYHRPSLPSHPTLPVLRPMTFDSQPAVAGAPNFSSTSYCPGLCKAWLVHSITRTHRGVLASVPALNVAVELLGAGMILKTIKTCQWPLVLLSIGGKDSADNVGVPIRITDRYKEPGWWNREDVALRPVLGDGAVQSIYMARR